MTKHRLLPFALVLLVVALVLSLSSALPTLASPDEDDAPMGPTCCLCQCGSLTRCEQSAGSLCLACPGGLNSTCLFEQVPGNCTAVPACAAGVGSAAAPTMGPNIMAVLAALLGAAGVLRVRKGRKRKPHK